MQTILFSLSRFPRIEFGAGKIQLLPEKIALYGQRVLIITGQHSFYGSPAWKELTVQLESSAIQWFHSRISGEPSPEYIDSTVQKFHKQNINCVVAIGGGSALDAGKAISGLLITGDSVMNYLEGVGAGKTYSGPAVPFIALPTTAGTGSEATKNAVLSHIAKNGYKKSFRDEQLIPQYAIVDPDLLISCPKSLIAANGMDALTQLLESYLSTKANPLTDALALSGLERVRDSLLLWYQSSAGDCSTGDSSAGHSHQPELALARANMAYAALLSGITLAQVGLGSVHGLASPLGAFFPIPHGVACGTVLTEAVRINIQAMQEREPDNIGLSKYAHIGRLLNKKPQLSDSEALQALVDFLSDWNRKMTIAPLSEFGISEQDIPRLVANISPSSMQTNPIILTQEEKEALVRNCL